MRVETPLGAIVNSHRYIIITPVRDEAQFIERTIRSVTTQTIRPVCWIIVNDGSTDATGDIVERAARENPWIQIVHRADRGKRAAGTGVVEAFYEGYSRIADTEWDFLVKLDGDLSFDRSYFEQCLDEFDKDPTLGIGGGVICHDVNGRLQVEDNPRFHVRGANKMYRRQCWTSIGHLIQAPGWDTADEVKANMLGWSTRTFQQLRVHHHRFTGTANGAWGNAVKNGLGSYICGYHPLFMIVKTANRLWRRPIVVGSMGMLYGFITGYVRRLPQIDDRDVIEYLRKQQVRRLLFCSTIWK